MAGEDRFANVFTADLTMSATNVATFLQMDFGISLRDNVAIVIDEIYFYPVSTTLVDLDTDADSLFMSLTMSDQITNIADLSDRRILYTQSIIRSDSGTPGDSHFHILPIKATFAPPMIALPTRFYFALFSAGMTIPGQVRMRLHYRTVTMSTQDKVIEILETFQLST